MRIKTSELQGAALDWAVAKCLGTEHLFAGHEVGRLRYATDWAQGGPIIERELIDTAACRDANEWEAATLGSDVDKDGYQPEHVVRAPTPLIAAMRCYVASKLGDEVDVPDELIYDKGDE